MIPRNSRARKDKRGGMSGEGKGECGRIWTEGGECWQRGNGSTQSATCYSICRNGWVGIGHERLENSGSILGWHPGIFILNCRGYTGCRRSYTRRIRAAIGHPFNCLIWNVRKWWAYSTLHPQGVKSKTSDNRILQSKLREKDPKQILKFKQKLYN